MYNITPFNNEGLDVGKDRHLMSYLYGLSDFWAYIFEDSSKTNLLLETTALNSSEIYSKFLQLTSRISLEDIAVQIDSQIKLIFIHESDAVSGKLETYKLSKVDYEESSLISAKYICNRPLLPTKTLEEDVHYRIDVESGTISFYKPISQLGFPSRILENGVRQYALWAINARVDKSLIYDTFAKLIKLDPQSSTENYKNLVFGLYYLYTNGPNIELLVRGLNLVLGIPLARDSEVVLDIQTHTDTNNYVVVTDLNSYIIPYGLVPDVNIGDKLEVSQEISSWVEIKDYISDGDWWINFKIPSRVMPDNPEGTTRYATKGSYADYIMREYLSRHTFLVNIKTTNFKNLQTFTELSNVINQVKPTYTNPFYIWTVPIEDEILEVSDGDLRLKISTTICEPLTNGIHRFIRNSSTPMTRGCPILTRFCAPSWVDKDSGRDSYINANGVLKFKGGNVDGFVSPHLQFREDTGLETSWGKEYFYRDHPNYRISRDNIVFRKDETIPVKKVDIKQGTPYFAGMRNVFLYTTTLWDVAAKFAYFGEEVPDRHWFTLGATVDVNDAINVHAINSSYSEGLGDILRKNFDFLFKRRSDIQLPKNHPKYSYEQLSLGVSEIRNEDFLLFVHVDEYSLGVWWVTANESFEGRPYLSVEDNDSDLGLYVTGPISRSVSKLGSPRYYVRGLYSGESSETDVKYRDNTNSEMPKTRGSTDMKIKVTVK